jgi:Flp pilus assembly pilin Flp
MKAVSSNSVRSKYIEIKPQRDYRGRFSSEPQHGRRAMRALWQRFWSGDSGATMVEYGLIVALIAVIAAAGVRQFGIAVNDNLFCVTAVVSGGQCP